MEFFTTIDFIICIIVGAIVGLLAGPVIKGKGLGLIGNIVVGLVGGVVGGWAFDVLDFMDIGDVLDPIIASVVGAAIFLAIANAIRR
jgi:uncharacterized membrane protein YeaQ/YmgE (transglycosylase-associated protein family)